MPDAVAAGIALVVVLWASVTYDMDTPEELASYLEQLAVRET